MIFLKQSRITARLISVAAAVLFVCSAAVPVYAESDANSWASPIESQTDATEPDPEEPEETEPEAPETPEETAPAAVLDPDFTTDEPEDPEDPEDNEPEDPEETVPAAALDQDDPPATTAPPATTTLPAATYTPEAEQTMYAPQVINIRSGPGTDYDKLGVLYANSEITVIGSSGEWAAVSYNGSTGYILRSLLSSTPPATTTPAPETAPPESEEAPPAEESFPPETEPTESEWQTPEMAQPVETTAAPIVPEETTTREPAAPAASTQPTDGGGLSPFLIAFLSAAAAFLLIGVLPVFIHRVHHKNLYRY